MNPSDIRAFFDDLNHEYLSVHRAKEELFWATYMATSDDHAGFADAEKAYKAFVSDPARLASVRERIAASAADSDLLAGLEGWRALFEANVIEGATGQADMARIVNLEAELFGKRAKYVLKHLNEKGAEEETTLGGLLTNEATNPSEAARESSQRALRGLERWVLDNGFIEIVRARNAFARGQGFESYFDYKVRKSEAMSPDELFAILEDFEKTHGKRALAPWNIRFYMSGDVLRETDPYFPFELALDRWARSFRRMGITYRQAVMQLDLLDRKGKYQNGFCHGPVPAYYDEGEWVPAHVNFTSEGRPSQIGSGQRALETLFHEGGHAAHFSNVAQNSPCFSQEFPPTSMAYAETQSMFCESVLGDADWLIRYAKKIDGSPMPPELIRKRIEASQPFRAYNDRMILVVPYFERALYALGDAEMRPDRILEMAREAERRILGAESSRPLLAIPHLLNQESAASYHGYLLAEMAVYQTRAWFLEKYGYIADNPSIGPLLAEKYWAPGNSMTHDQILRNLTGEGFNPRYLAEACNATPEEAWAAARESMAEAAEREYATDYPASLDADLRIVHGKECYADNSVSEEIMCEDFARYVAAQR
jgi:oligoendopeptidase F